MEEFLMSSQREGSYLGTFSNNSKDNSHHQKNLLRSNDASVKNIEVCSTSKFDAQMLQHEIQNIRHNQVATDSMNFNSQSIDHKIQADLQYELNDLTDKEDISHRNQYDDLLGFKNNHKIYDFNSQAELSSSNMRKPVNKLGQDQGSSSFMHQSFSSQLNNIALQSSNNQQNFMQNNLNSAQQMQHVDALNGNFSLAPNNDVTQDEMLLDYEGQMEVDQEGLEEQETSVQFKKSTNKFYNIKTQSEQQFQQQQALNNYRLSDSNPLLPLHDQSNIKQKYTNSQNFKLFNQKQNVKKNNYLTSEESNPAIPNSNGGSNGFNQKFKQQLKQISGQEDTILNTDDDQLNTFANNKRKEDYGDEDEEEEYDEGYASQASGLNVQFVTLQNDLGDSMQKKVEQNQYFHMNNSMQNSGNGGFRDDFMFNNQSAHFSTMNPQYLENCQHQYNVQENKKGINTKMATIPENNKIKTDADREQNHEQAFDTNSSLYTPNRLYNIQQTTEQSNRSSARMVDYNADQNQINQYTQNQYHHKNIKNNNQIHKKKNTSSSYQNTIENNDNSYKTIDVNEQKKSSTSINSGDQEVMQKLYKKNQELTQQNNKINHENSMLKQELENMKSDLLKKYEDIRKNNENLFKSFEEQSNLMLKKQKEKYEEKIQKLQLQLRDQETQNLYKKDNFRDRNSQLYAMVLKLEKEKQELHDKNLQLIKKQINIKSENHKNALGMVNTTVDQSDLEVNKSQLLSQSSVHYRKIKMGNDDSTLNIDNHYTMNNQNSFCQGILSPNSFSSRNNYKSKSIDIVRKNIQWNSALNINDKTNNNQYTNANQQSEVQFQDFKVQAEKLILEKKYDDLFGKYKRILDENHVLRKNKMLTINDNKDNEKSLDQQSSSIISPSATTVEGRFNNYISQQANNNFLSQQTNNYQSQQTNNNSTQCTSYYMAPPSREPIFAKPFHKTENHSVNTSILSKERNNSYFGNKKSINFKSGQNNILMYDPLNSSACDDQETANQSKTDSSCANILLYQNYKTQDSNDSPFKAIKKKSIQLNYYNPSKLFQLVNTNQYFSQNIEYFNNEVDKENNMNAINKTINIDQMSDQNPCSLVRMNNYVLSSKYADEAKQKRKSQSKNKDSKKKKQNKSSLDISGVREKIKGGINIDDKENNLNNNYIKNALHQEKTKKTRSNSVAKTPSASTKTTINHDKDNSYFEGNKQTKKGNGINTSKNEIKRSSSNNRGCKTPIFSKIKV